jgi:hypothetical protein
MGVDRTPAQKPAVSTHPSETWALCAEHILGESASTAPPHSRLEKEGSEKAAETADTPWHIQRTQAVSFGFNARLQRGQQSAATPLSG